MRRIGFVVNPIAGMGGRVGLKGTDGKVEEALERGAKRRAPSRARDALVALADTTEDIELLTYGGVMGTDQARTVGFDPVVVGDPAGDGTSAADTREAVAAFIDRGVDLILFVGGDGTAVDVAQRVEDAAESVPILGVPAGVKVYSEVFGVSPEAAGHIAGAFETTESAEVNDIDEDEYRDGEVKTELRALATVPAAEQRQSSKQLGGGSVEGIAEGFAEEVTRGTTYVLAPGSTVGAVADALGVEGTALGVDVYRDGELVVTDGAAEDILGALGDENVIVVSPIGGQGFIFGRGNQQISPAVIREAAVEIVASRRKLDDIGVLRVDTGDSDLDESLRGWQRVRVGRHERRLMEVV
ncbi:NAD+ kinase [Halovenus aranensis]|uniref:NAD+ kinase n=1 Tax=Halovenus aranensis TaxID=890420 RepID=A0A1G8Z1P5_9EURY|nr:ATP-NAD kinase family protein [Halovenus aranensis]SDK09049.1 NAD+ kinase [Halovenus aranensis]